MAPSRIDNTPFDRNTMDKPGRRDEYRPGDHSDRGHTDRAYDSRDGRKRKGHEHYDHETPPKRMKGRTPSPRRSDYRPREDRDRRERRPSREASVPQQSRDFHSGPRPDRRGQGQRPARHDHQEADDMEDIRPTAKKIDSSNPLSRASAAWIPDIEVSDDDTLLKDVQAVMGFAGFKSTRERQVPGNSRNFGVKKKKETQYRQYMNRVGGFNRPLSPPKD